MSFWVNKPRRRGKKGLDSAVKVIAFRCTETEYMRYASLDKERKRYLSDGVRKILQSLTV